MATSKRSRIMCYLKRKIAGGLINQRGNDYEICYAIYRIMVLADSFSSQAHLINLSTQIQGFVDDFYVENLVVGQIKESYYQLKTSAKLYWGADFKEGSLYFDFSKQKECLLRKKNSFQLVLVVGVSETGDFLRNYQPSALKKYCIVEDFPWAGSINLQLTSVAPFKAVAERLCAFNDADKVASLVSHFVGAWTMTDKKNIPLGKILELVRSRGSSFLKSSPHYNLRREVKTILDAIPGFRYQVVNGYLAWHFLTTYQGLIPHALGSPEFRNIEEEIIIKQPITFTDIETLIS